MTSREKKEVVHSVHYDRFLAAIRQKIAEKFAGCRQIAIKLHFGEPGNQKALKPSDLQRLCDLLRDLGLEVFLFDSTVAYANSRRSDPESHLQYAREKGWERVAPVVTQDEAFIVKKGRHMTYEVCQKLSDADGVLVVSHVKGHVCSGFGGAIKNLGMGALTKRSKGAIHQGGKPVVRGECTRCGTCVSACPLDGIRLENGPVFDVCFGCSDCITVCPENILKPQIALFDELLADGASIAASTFKRQYYVSMLLNITKLCDCCADPEEVIAEDAGYLGSEDAVAIDAAACDMIKRVAGKDVFWEHNKKSGTEQVAFAAEYGLGSRDYVLRGV